MLLLPLPPLLLPHLVQCDVGVYEQILLGSGAQLVRRGIALLVQGAATPNRARGRGEEGGGREGRGGEGFDGAIKGEGRRGEGIVKGLQTREGRGLRGTRQGSPERRQSTSHPPKDSKVVLPSKPLIPVQHPHAVLV